MAKITESVALPAPEAPQVTTQVYTEMRAAAQHALDPLLKHLIQASGEPQDSAPAPPVPHTLPLARQLLNYLCIALAIVLALLVMRHLVCACLGSRSRKKRQ
jgi:hypothetical protein